VSELAADDRKEFLRWIGLYSTFAGSRPDIHLFYQVTVPLLLNRWLHPEARNRAAGREARPHVARPLSAERPSHARQ
jgi:hypothetical protein